MRSWSRRVPIRLTLTQEAVARIGFDKAYILPSRDGLRVACRKTFSSIIGDRAIDDRAAVDTLPCVENEKEIGKPLQHHHAFALRTFHHFLPGG